MIESCMCYLLFAVLFWQLTSSSDVGHVLESCFAKGLDVRQTGIDDVELLAAIASASVVSARTLLYSDTGR